ncbi:MAG: fimbrillin family protein [Bacteroidales bacterium]|nr:fimbrillin family protein [Bacteroidales bacterium]
MTRNKGGRNTLRYLPMLLAVAALGLSACSTEELPDNGGNSNGKTAIEFAMSNTGGIGMSLDSRAGFGQSTRIVMRIGSESTDDGSLKYTRTTATASKQVTTGTADYSTVTFAQGTEMRYWDDAHGRKSQLSVYAVAIPDKNSGTLLPENKLSIGTLGENSKWASESTPDNTIAWTVSADQSTAGTVSNQDLCYSNNIQTGGKNGVYQYKFSTSDYPAFPGCNPDGTIIEKSPRTDGLIDGVMKYYTEPGYSGGKFDRGHMIFRHALTRITVKLKAGDGYDPSTAFVVDHVQINKIRLADGTNTKLNLVDGTWSGYTTGQTITKMEKATPQASATHHREFVAQTIPGDEIDQNSTENRLELVVDNNIYYITDKMLFTAFSTSATDDISGDKLTLRQGRNYEINVTVSKKKIDNITASIIPWATVTSGNMDVNNAYIQLDLYTPSGTTINGSYEAPLLFRLDDPSSSFIFNDTDWKHYKWYTKYDKYNSLTWDGTNNRWTTDLFFESNYASYHFRMTNEKTDSKIHLGPGSSGPFGEADYFDIDTSEKDIWWGAPLLKTATLKYDYEHTASVTSGTDYRSPLDGGFSSSIHWGIAATESPIKFTMLHIKSQIDVVLKTTTGSDAVKLKDGDNTAIVKVVRAFNKGNVELGRGMVKTSGSTGDLALNQPTTYFKTDKVETNPYWLYYVPQQLSNGSNYVGIEITTPDGNIYKINKLSDITAKTVVSDVGQGQTESQKILRWLPNHHYTYTFTLKKTEVTATATVTKWNEVTADKEDVTIE